MTPTQKALTSVSMGHQFETSISNQLRDNHSHAGNRCDFMLPPDIGNGSSASGRFLPVIAPPTSWPHPMQMTSQVERERVVNCIQLHISTGWIGTSVTLAVWGDHKATRAAGAGWQQFMLFSLKSVRRRSKCTALRTKIAKPTS